MSKKVLIGGAWPYANGSLHLGHVAALLGGDIIARYHRAKGDDVMYVSGSDSHGTPIVVAAEQKGVEPAEIADKYHKEFTRDFERLGFSYTNYTKTTTDNHRKVVQELFLKIRENGFLETKTEELAFDESTQRFLPDRYLEGECPICHYENARGDQCDNCGSLLDAKDLINPRSKVSKEAPVWRESEHFYLKLSALESQIREFITNSKNWRQNAKNFSLGFIADGIHDRAITRDTAWGIPVPLDGYEKKCIYVWFEAVTGYLSAAIEHSPDNWEEFWANPDALHYYVHGKDNIPFHTIIWPGMLMARGGLNLPDRIISSEYLTLEKKQFSTSRNWAVWIPDFLHSFDPEFLRYYLTINGPENSDADFSWHEFQAKINNELIANYGNLVNRTFSIIRKHFPEGVEAFDNPSADQKDIIELAKKSFEVCGEHIEKGAFKLALKQAMKVAEETNKHLSRVQPWELVKTDKDQASKELSFTAHIIENIAQLMSPFMPFTNAKVQKMLKRKETAKWEYQTPGPVSIDEIEPLYQKIWDPKIEEQLAKLG